MAESMYMILVALFFFWMCKEGVLADGTTFGTLLTAVITETTLRLLGRSFVIIQSIAYHRIVCLRKLNFRSRELPICTKICTKASSLVFL